MTERKDAAMDGKALAGGDLERLRKDFLADPRPTGSPRSPGPGDSRPTWLSTGRFVAASTTRVDDAGWTGRYEPGAERRAAAGVRRALKPGAAVGRHARRDRAQGLRVLAEYASSGTSSTRPKKFLLPRGDHRRPPAATLRPPRTVAFLMHRDGQVSERRQWNMFAALVAKHGPRSPRLHAETQSRRTRDR